MTAISTKQEPEASFLGNLAEQKEQVRDDTRDSEYNSAEVHVRHCGFDAQPPLYLSIQELRYSKTTGA